MKPWQSKVGWALAGLYLATTVVLIRSQGLFPGDSLIAVFLGIPWSVFLVTLNDTVTRNNVAPLLRINPLYLVGLYV